MVVICSTLKLTDLAILCEYGMNIKDSLVRCQRTEVLVSMIAWNNKIMKTHGRSIRAKIFEAYRQSFARACIVYRVEKKRQELAQAKLLNDYMDSLSDNELGHT